MPATRDLIVRMKCSCLFTKSSKNVVNIHPVVVVTIERGVAFLRQPWSIIGLLAQSTINVNRAAIWGIKVLDIIANSRRRRWCKLPDLIGTVSTLGTKVLFLRKLLKGKKGVSLYAGLAWHIVRRACAYKEGDTGPHVNGWIHPTPPCKIGYSFYDILFRIHGLS